jgi:hypothetical protein
MPDFGLGLFVPHRRSIGGIIADVTIEETERDDVTFTQHPVEQGAPIGDHAFKQPEEVVLRVGWSEGKTGDLSAESGIYGILLNWQASFVLFDLFTGKRRHRNMGIASINVVTDEHSENILGATLVLKEVILTQTQTAQTGLSNNPSDQTNPGSTSQVADLGTQQGASIEQSGGTSSPASDTVISNFNDVAGASIEQTGQ